MSQTIKKLALVVGIVAISVATFGGAAALYATFGSLGVSGALAAGSGVLGLSVGDLFAIGAGLVSIGSSPTPPSVQSTGATSRGTATVDANALGSFIFGKTAVPLSVAFALNG